MRDVARPEPTAHRPPTAATYKELYATALRCGKPGCVQLLYRASETGARVLNSTVAHIHARSMGGPRWDPTMSETDNRSYDNLILLCEAHSSEIDDTPEHYPAELLREWKREQVAVYERAATAGVELTDAEVAEVAKRSFGAKELAADIAEAVVSKLGVRNRDEALDLAVRQSYARRVRRLRPVPSDRRDAVLIWMAEQDDPVLIVPEGRLRVLVADMGAGKTEHAMRWWDEGLLAAQADVDIEVPVWLDARDISSGLDAAVRATLGHGPARSCRIVIDNLDGVLPREAARLLEQARELVTAWPRSSVLVTSRPGVLASGDELIKVGPWPVERGVELVRTVADDELWRVWTKETEDLLTSPLTAIAVAARLRTGRDVRVSRVTLLADLARSIIEQERPDQPTQQIWDGFARLAVRVLGSSTPVRTASFGKEPQVWELTDTGLVVNDEGNLRFALPVFEQHFGAQAIRDGAVELEAVASAGSFPRWRYALASAVASAELAEAERYALRIARTNPGALSWIMGEVSSAGGTASGIEAMLPWAASAGSGTESDTAVQRGGWLREALQALLSGFGACSREMARHRDGRLVQWGVSGVDDWICLGEARDALPPPDVIPVPHEHQEVTIASGWSRWTQFQFPSEDFGRWSWARERLTGPLRGMLRRRRLPLPEGSPLAQERLWVLAQRVMQIARQPWSFAIPLADLRQVVDGMMEHVEMSVHSRWQGGGEEIDSHDVRWIHAQLQHETATVLESPWPPPDRVSSRRRWRWDGYSPELTLDIHTRVLRDALDGYQGLVEHNFASFGSALGLYGVLPVRVQGIVIADEDGVDNPQGRLLYEFHPDPKRQHRSQPQVNLQLSTQAEIPKYYARAQMKPPKGSLVAPADKKATPFYTPKIQGSDLLTGLSRPATNLAFEWLASDLQALGWSTESVRFYD